MPKSPYALVVSCEHAGNEIPAPWADALSIPPDVLTSHRGIDPGSFEYGAALASAPDTPLIVNPVTRLLVDANRSLANPELFSEYARALPEELRTRALDEIWRTHRSTVEAEVRRGLERSRQVLHVSAHSFTPALDGHVRNVDIGLLFDPARTFELAIVLRWQGLLLRRRSDLRVRRNEPYSGLDDGLTRDLRQVFPDEAYAGIEVEVSQRFPADTSAAGRQVWASLILDLQQTLCEAMTSE